MEQDIIFPSLLFFKINHNKKIAKQSFMNCNHFGYAYLENIADFINIKLFIEEQQTKNENSEITVYIYRNLNSKLHISEILEELQNLSNNDLQNYVENDSFELNNNPILQNAFQNSTTYLLNMI